MKVRPGVAALSNHPAEMSVEAIRKAIEPESVCMLAAAENPLGPSEAAADAVRVAAAKTHLRPDDYCYDLRLTLAEQLGLRPYQLLFGHDTTALTQLITSVYLQAGDEIILPQATTNQCIRIAALCGAQLKPIPLTDDFRLDLPAMAAAISLRTKMLWLDMPSQLAGTVIPKRELMKMLHRIGSDPLVVLDESYIEYVEDPEAANGIDLLAEFSNLIVLRSFSHAYGLAGLNLGYAAAQKRRIDELNKARLPYGVNMLAQIAATATLRDKEYLKKSVKYNRVERDFLANGLRDAGYTVLPSQTNFLLFDTRTDSRWLVNDLQRQGVLVQSGAAFGHRTMIRVSVGLHEDNTRFLTALKQTVR